MFLINEWNQLQQNRSSPPNYQLHGAAASRFGHNSTSPVPLSSCRARSNARGLRETLFLRHCELKQLTGCLSLSTFLNLLFSRWHIECLPPFQTHFVLTSWLYLHLLANVGWEFVCFLWSALAWPLQLSHGCHFFSKSWRHCAIMNLVIRINWVTVNGPSKWPWRNLVEWTPGKVHHCFPNL